MACPWERNKHIITPYGVWSCKEYTLKKIHHLVRWFFHRFPAPFDFPWNIPLWSTYTAIIPLDVRIKTSIYGRFSHCHDYWDWFAAYNLNYNTSYNLWKIASSIQATNHVKLFKISIFSSRIFPFPKDRRVTILGAAGPLSKWLKKKYGIPNIHYYNYMGYIRINPFESLPPKIKNGSPQTTPLDLRAPLFQCLLGSVRHDGGGVLRSDKLQQGHPKNMVENLWKIME